MTTEIAVTVLVEPAEVVVVDPFASASSALAAAASAAAAAVAETNAEAAQAAAEAARDETVVAVAAQSDWTGAVSLSAGNVSKSNYFRRRLTGNATLGALPAGVAGKAYTVTLEIVQDATGGRTFTWPTVKWPYGVAHVVTSTANARDLVHLLWNGTDWVGMVGGQAIA